MTETAAPAIRLPDAFERWFAARGWRPHPYQMRMVEAARSRDDVLLIAPTGGGKTLSGFLPSLIELVAEPADGLHTLYISPLKALAVDIARNLDQPIAEIGLDIACETRTGDTPQKKRQRQRETPPQMLLTTPESLALMLSYEDAPSIFKGLRRVIVDEIHALADNKRGDLLSLGLARLRTISPNVQFVGLSATVAFPDDLGRWLGPTTRLIKGQTGAQAAISILTHDRRIPWSGHMALHALPEVMEEIRRHRTTLVFVNTRAQAEIVFDRLWRLNDETLPIALHHGSLAIEQRRKVEGAMAVGKLRAVVATSSLDLGIDWASVDLVVQMGAPKGASRLLQRIGRANHRIDEPSKAILVPGNRFEFLECQAAIDAIAERTLDGEPPRTGGLDVLAQHILGSACSAPIDPDRLYDEVCLAGPYAGLTRKDFDDTLRFVENGGYALGGYDRFRRLFRDSRGLFHITGAKEARAYRMNIGTIVEAPTLKVRVGRGRPLGEVEEYFAQGLVPGDSFIFAGQLLRFEEIREMSIIASRLPGDREPKIPAYMGGRFPLSTHLAERVRRLLWNRRGWKTMPDDVREWLGLQDWRSLLPGPDGLLVECFPRAGKHFTAAYCFEGRNAHQTLGMLLTRRMERAGYGPLGYVATDYVIAVWSLRPVEDVEGLFDQDMLGDDLEEWMAESSLLKRTFRNVAVIAGLIERRQPGQEKSGRQVTISSDLIYDVLRRHEPDHILLRATRADAAGGLTDIRRLAQLLERAQGRIRVRRLDRVSPLAVPVLLEIGREMVYGAAMDDLLDEAAEDLIAEATAPEGDQKSLL
jgi:ATP-dependent Lhr-like helicase